MPNPEIRETIAKDLPALTKVVDETGLFPSAMLAEMASPAIAGQSDTIWLTCLVDGTPVGLCYARPEQFAEGVWNMLALAVLPARQGTGLGTLIVARLEENLRARGQRMLIVDTSGANDFAPTRRFYALNGYQEEARIRDYWTHGDDKVTFRKVLM